MKSLSLLVFMLSLVTGCGKAHKKYQGEAPPSPSEAPLRNPSPSPVNPNSIHDFEGQFQTNLAPINPLLKEGLRGSATISREGDEVVADVQLVKAFPQVVYAQTLREGSECPTKADDINNDGFVDAVEGEALYGKTLMPLDGDINTQASLARMYPLSNQYGSYIYSNVASYTSLMLDLRDHDPSAEDDYVKLSASIPLDLETRVIVIQGVPKDLLLPETVQSTSGQLPHLTLPIACGKFKKVIDAPGVAETTRPPRSIDEVNPEDILAWSLGTLD